MEFMCGTCNAKSGPVKKNVVPKKNLVRRDRFCLSNLVPPCKFLSPSGAPAHIVLSVVNRSHSKALLSLLSTGNHHHCFINPFPVFRIFFYHFSNSSSLSES